MDDHDLFQTARFPTPKRPLLGLTVLVVEDSRYACDALRLICLNSGARFRRADSLASAERHLRVYAPSVLVVDLGLPDGSGLDLICRLTAQSTPIEAILAISGDDSQEAMALQAGADGFLAKPVQSLASFQEMILCNLPETRRPMDPRMINEMEVTPDPAIYAEDLHHARILLDSQPDDRTLDYVTQFVISLSRSAGDTDMLDAGQTLAITRMRHAPPDRALQQLNDLITDRLRMGEPALSHLA